MLKQENETSILYTLFLRIGTLEFICDNWDSFFNSENKNDTAEQLKAISHSSKTILRDQFNVFKNHFPESFEPFVEGDFKQLNHSAKIAIISDLIVSTSYSEGVDGKSSSSLPILKSIFNAHLHDSESFIVPQELSLNNLPVPKSLKKDVDLITIYEDRRKKLIEDLKWINQDADFEVIIERLLSLYDKHFSTIPSDLYHVCNCPLSVHIRLATAVSACLYKADLSESDLEALFFALNEPGKDSAALPQKRFTLLCLDLSGIQDFIYSIVSEKALKGLRGRSVYLQMLIECASLYMIDKYQVCRANLLYTGGGKNFVLLPQIAADELRNIISEFETLFLDAHQGTISMVLGITDLSIKDMTSDYSEKILEISRAISVNKKQKFKNSLADPLKFNRIMGPLDEGGEKIICEICGVETGNEPQCDFCKSFTDLATDISYAQYLTIKKVNREITGYHSYQDVLAKLGYFVHFGSNSEPDSIQLRLNNSNVESSDQSIAGFRFMANNSPLHEKNVKTLEQIARSGEGIHRWAVLRADVDELGKLFLAQSSLLSTITLSGLLSYYFTAHVESIVRQKYKDSVYIIYSGGDDLFMIGHHSVLAFVAKDIYDDFRLFCCKQKTLSASVYIAPSEKFPTYQAANTARICLEHAKSDGRNRINIWGESVEWDKLNTIIKMQRKIVDLIRAGVARSALLTILASAWTDFEKSKPITRIWRLMYALKRLQLRHKEQLVNLTEVCNHFIFDNKPKDNMNIAIRWAELLTRNQGGQNG